jgi:hypothetical protein
MSTGYVRILLDGAGLAAQCDTCTHTQVFTTWQAAKDAAAIHRLEHHLDDQEHR